jgi:hypothetical protein
MKETQLRLPDDVSDWITTQAKREVRSINGQIVWCVRKVMGEQIAQRKAQQREATR